MFLITLCLILELASFEGAPPRVEDIRNAWKQNLDRFQNRRIKYVLVRLSGEQRKEFPNVDHPQRFEFEEVYSKDGRWRRHMVVYTDESMTKEDHRAWDGVRATTFSAPMKPDGRKLQADIRGIKSFPSEEHVFDMNVTQPVIDRLGIRSRISLSPLGKGLILLNVYEDDRAGIQARYTVDPTKNYWPVSYEWWVMGEAEKYGQIVHEFAQTQDGSWYPKRVVHTQKDSTRHYIVVDAEFPSSFDDSAFAVHLPQGVEVTDSVGRRTFTVGGEERLWPPTPEPGLAEDLRRIPAEDWLFYGGFGAAVTALVGATWYYMARNKGGTKVKP